MFVYPGCLFVCVWPALRRLLLNGHGNFGKCVHTRIHVGGGGGALAGGYVGEILLYENEVCVCVSASVCACVCTGVGFCMCVD